MDFHKEMRGFYMHSVTLPENVTAYFTRLIGKFLEFKRHSGGSWQVELIRSGDKLVLQSGWSNFASANNVSQNDLLRFKFIGESRFEVQVFDQLGLEKSSDPMQLLSRIKTSSPTDERSKNPRLCLAVSDNSCYIPVNKVLSAEQKKRFHQLASEVQLGNPSFLKILIKSSLSMSGIKLSRPFCLDHLPRETQTVVLCLPNKEKTWLVKYYHGRSHQTFECNPWMKFVQENKLQEGDMCLFELVKATEQITFIVHVSRAT